jgi:ribosomal protein S2
VFRNIQFGSEDAITVKMAAPSNLPAAFAPSTQDVEMLLSSQAHLGSKNLQVHMEPYLWKTRPDGINVINISKTWYALPQLSVAFLKLTTEF